jgi:hypothetical protein
MEGLPSRKNWRVGWAVALTAGAAEFVMDSYVQDFPYRARLISPDWNHRKWVTGGAAVMGDCAGR